MVAKSSNKTQARPHKNERISEKNPSARPNKIHNTSNVTTTATAGPKLCANPERCPFNNFPGDNPVVNKSSSDPFRDSSASARQAANANVIFNTQWNTTDVNSPRNESMR